MTPRTWSNALVQFVLRHARVETFGCSRQSTESGYSLVRRTVPDYNLIFVTRGRPVWVLGDDPIHLKPQSLLIVPPGVSHHGYSETDRVTLLSLHVRATLPGGQDAFEVLELPRTQRVKRNGRLDRYLRGALDEFVGQLPRHDRLMSGWCHLVVMEMLDDSARRGQRTPRAIDPLVGELLDELARRIGQPTTLDDLAAFTGFSAQHVNRLFGRELGITPLQYLTRMRMDRAGELLLENRLTVAAVGHAVGYEDPAYFSRAFSQHFGHSPSDHRAARDSDYPS